MTITKLFNNNSMNFKEAYCQYFGCSSKRFPKHLFWTCFGWPLPVSIIGWFVVFLVPGVARNEFIAIDQIARTTTQIEFQHEISDILYLRHRDGAFLKRLLGFHLSIGKLKCVRLKIFGIH